jgi:putative transcriptional regulator
MAPPSGPVRALETDGAAGVRVRAARKEAGLTQQGLSAAVQVSRQTIIAMETGDYAPSVFLAIKVARARRDGGETLGRGGLTGRRREA